MRRNAIAPILLIIIFLALAPQFARGGEDSQEFIHQGDALFLDRQNPAKNLEALTWYEKAAKLEPNNYEANWKTARSYWFAGDNIRDTESKEAKAQHRDFGGKGRPYAEQAVKIKPEGVDGHAYLTLCIGEYGIGTGILKAVKEGLAKQYEIHALKAYALDKNYDHGLLLRALGRYYYSLPWPLRDKKKSIEYLEEGLKNAPENVRGYVYLAESYLAVKEKDKAKSTLEKALPVNTAPDVEPDQSYWKLRAKDLLSGL